MEAIIFRSTVKIFFGLVSLLLWPGVAVTAVDASAETGEIRLHSALLEKTSAIRVVKGSGISLVNERGDALYNIAIVNAAGKSVATIKELPGGQSVRLSFRDEGLFQIFCSLERDQVADADSFIQVRVEANPSV
jgi:hypothetical protein